MSIMRALPLLLFVVCAEARDFKPEQLRNLRAMKFVTSANAKTVQVDCTKGKGGLQAAVDAATGPTTIEVDGICVENVRIERKDTLTLIGDDPLADGVQGTGGTVAAVEVFHSRAITLENLSISDSPTTGLGAWFSFLLIDNLRIANNAQGGMNFGNSAGVNGNALAVSNNGVRGALVQRGATFFCVACDFTGHPVAAVANQGGTLSLLDSMVTGTNGIRALGPSYADVDCSTESTPHPCGVNVTSVAVLASVSGTAAMWGGVDFTGRVVANEQGHVLLFGSRQLSATGGNGVATFSTLWLEPDAMQSQLSASTNVQSFGRLLVHGASVLNGNVTCQSAGDAWLDATVVKGPGVTVTGCEHAP